MGVTQKYELRVVFNVKRLTILLGTLLNVYVYYLFLNLNVVSNSFFNVHSITSISKSPKSKNPQKVNAVLFQIYRSGNCNPVPLLFCLQVFTFCRLNLLFSICSYLHICMTLHGQFSLGKTNGPITKGTAVRVYSN